MKKCKGFSKIWYLVLLLVAFVAGCAGNDTVTQNSPKAITAYSLAGVTGTINEAAKTIAVTMPYGTDGTALVATFTTTGASVKVGTAIQTSGTGVNNFTSPVAYTVTSVDDTTATYSVTVTMAPISAKAITVYSLAGVAGTIDETAKTIAVTMPYGTNVTALVGTFSTTGARVNVGTVVQVSATTANNFVSPVAYTVTAADSSAVTYTVTVTVAANSAKAITAYSLNGVAGTITAATKAIAVTMPIGTNVTNLIATFTTTGTGVKVGSAAQTSGTSQNNFTSPVAYIVTAADNTTATYNVTVTVASATSAKGPAAVNLGTAGNYVILAETQITTTGTTAVTGDLGISPAAATYVQGFSLTLDPSGDFSTTTPASLVTGRVYAADYNTGGGGTPSKLTTAVNDMMTAYTDAAGRPTPDFSELYGGDISGKILVPGLYKWSTGVLMTSDVTLDGGPNDVWIFQVSGDITMANATNVKLTGGAQPKNIFWQVGGGTGVSIGTTAHFEGIILATKAITLNTGASTNGRLLSQTAVTLDSNAITAP